jgi:hypothetical protein
MTTTLKSVKRETLSTHRGRALVIELHSTYITMRQKGRRLRYAATYDQIWTLGARNAAEALRQELAARKKAQKEGRKHA